MHRWLALGFLVATLGQIANSPEHYLRARKAFNDELAIELQTVTAATFRDCEKGQVFELRGKLLRVTLSPQAWTWEDAEGEVQMNVESSRTLVDGASLAGSWVRVLLKRVSPRGAEPRFIILASVSSYDFDKAYENHLKSLKRKPTDIKERFSRPGKSKSDSIVLGRLGQVIRASSLYSKPDVESPVYCRASAWEYVVVTSRLDGWLAVLLNNGRTGFVLADDLLLHDDLVRKSPPLNVSAAALAQSFDRNEIAARDKYAGKTLRVKGKIERISEQSNALVVSLVGSAVRQCVFYCDPSWRERLKKLAAGKMVTLTGKLHSVSPLILRLTLTSMD